MEVRAARQNPRALNSKLKQQNFKRHTRRHNAKHNPLYSSIPAAEFRKPAGRQRRLLFDENNRRLLTPALRSTTARLNAHDFTTLWTSTPPAHPGREGYEAPQELVNKLIARVTPVSSRASSRAASPIKATKNKNKRQASPSSSDEGTTCSDSTVVGSDSESETSSKSFTPSEGNKRALKKRSKMKTTRDQPEMDIDPSPAPTTCAKTQPLNGPNNPDDQQGIHNKFWVEAQRSPKQSYPRLTKPERSLATSRKYVASPASAGGSTQERSTEQCHRCQRYGHASANCHVQPRCVKCLVPHWTSECSRSKELGDKPACVNCGQEHTANYGGCPKAPKVVSKPTNRTDKKLLTNKKAPPTKDALNFPALGAKKSSNTIDDRFAPAPMPSSNPWIKKQLPRAEPEPSRRQTAGVHPSRLPHVNTQTEKVHLQTTSKR
ncbi:Nucleic-acid-binding protein from transposon X-element [Eumeta japonica]|uniref:Nucleic-acid-binding protein from transposon X-element n=1 Tax=Eumeta variegata TaxID=151549 RepID=A0A4C1ZNX9_EUMVA|nr:Nucleic-acid-binding protein from transposon X-element [Eumeta japonica]